MKKILFVTTALVGAMSLASAALADAPKVSVGGFLDFQAGAADEDVAASNDYGFQNDTEVHFSVDGKSDSGLGYGAVVELEADSSADADGSGTNADKSYLYLNGNWGRWEMGVNAGADSTLKVDASTFARGTGGIDGDWYDFVSSTAGYIISPNLPLAHSTNNVEDATKLTYYSPRFSGFQIGASWIPDTGDNGQAPFSGDTNAGDAENALGLGINYTGQVQNMGIALSATGEFGSSESAAVEDLGAWALGSNISIAGFVLGASYGSWEDSLSVSGSDSDYWTAGGGYDFGPFGSSLTYLNSEAGSNEFDNLSIGVDYELAPGMTPYVEASFFDMDAPGVALDNSGTVFLVGSQLNF
ncbi:MAG: porin [Alphaproteobacteria bacterium]|nr:porin [Alphaproteobacteria bacterium]